MRLLKSLTERQLFWLLVCGAAILRFINLGCDVLWYDEAFTAWIAKLPFSQFPAAVLGDVHPPTFYLIEWVIVHLFGSSEAALRFVSACFGVVAVLLVYHLARVLNFAPMVRFGAAFCVALLPGALYYSQEARAYSMLACAVLTLVIGALEARWWLAFSGALGCCYLHNLGLFYALAVGAVSLLITIRARQRDWWKPLLAFGAAGLLWLPWGALLVTQLRNVTGGFWIPPQSPLSFLQLSSLMISLRTPAMLQIAQIPLVLALSGVAFVVGRDIFRGRQGAILGAALFVAPALAIVTSIFYKPLFLPRAFLGSVLIAVGLWTYAASKLGRANRRVYLGGVTLLLTISLAGHFFPVGPRENGKEAAGVVRAEWQAGDIVYFQSPAAQILFGYYLADLPQVIHPDANDLYQSLSPAAKIAFGFHQENWPPSGAQRVWVVAFHTWTTSARELAFQDEMDRTASVRYEKGPDASRSIVWLVDLANAAK